MDTTGARQLASWRLAVMGVLMLAGFAVLAARLHRVQVQRSPFYTGAAARQSIRRVLLPGTRGRILDRHGVCLADNRPSYCLAVYIEELRRPGPWSNTVNAVDHELDRLAGTIGLPRQCTREDIAAHVRRRLPLPFLAWQDVDARALARFAESLEPFPGVDIYSQPERVYPLRTVAAHVLGYVGRDRPAVTNEAYHYYVSDMRGKAGMEVACDTILAGEPGGQLIRVDAAGYKHDTWDGRPPVAGRDVILTLDVRIQERAERLLAGHRAAAVVLDPRTGEVLALVSLPSFDPNQLSPSPPRELWEAITHDPAKPLFNRAVTGRYPPGSTFKPVVAVAALERGIAPGTVFTCPGYFELGPMRLHCWFEPGHGPLPLRTAIEQSCNPYFCHLGLAVGYPQLQATARSLGFGARSGIALPGESIGLLPDDAWKRRALHDGWRSGDTANVSIGQGALLVTPLQMAVYAAALANGGTVWKPRLILAPQPDIRVPARRLGWSATTLETVRGGMHDVVENPSGTGKRARVPGLVMGGKTGTAEFGPAGRRRKHTWMIAFAPFDAPTVAVAMVVEDGISGGLTVAPLVRELMASIFDCPLDVIEPPAGGPA